MEDYYIERKDILLDGYNLGTLYVTVSLDDINQRLLRYIAIVSLIFVAAGVFAFVLAIKLQKIITGPIDELADVARKIHHDKSYSIRVRKVTNDEIGQLVVAFNDMLEGIEDRDLMLVDAKKNLEEIVRERTAELREAQSELIRKDRMATLGQLTATVSHELRNPLGTIRTSMFTLANRINSKDDSVKHVFERIDRNIVRCDSIITELLDYSRIRALQHQKTNLGHWIKRLLDEINLPDDISISLNLDDSVEAEIDRDLFRRVLVNVIENAMQAIHSMDGSVSAKNIIIECRINHGRTEIIITDTGPGIKQEILPRIFEPLFRRVLVNVIENAMQAIHSMDVSVSAKSIIIECRINHGRTEIIITDTGPGIKQEILPRIFEPLFSTKTFGIGLGLSIVKQIMLQHGGNVDIDSEPGIGTRVVLWLPCVSKTVSQAVSLAAKHGS